MMKNSTNSDYHCVPFETDKIVWNSLMEIQDPTFRSAADQSKRIDFEYASKYFGDLEVASIRVHESEPAFKCYDSDFFLYSYCRIWTKNALANSKIHGQCDPCILIGMFANYTNDDDFCYAFVHDRFLKQADQTDLKNQFLYGVLQQENSMDHVERLPSKMLRHARMYDYVEKMLPDSDEIIDKICNSRWEDFTLSDCYEETMIANESNGGA